MKLTPFAFINNIFNKTKTVQDYTDDEMVQYSPFLANRSASMSNDDFAVFINDTLNRNGFMEDKKEHFKFLQRVVPKGRSPIYMKKRGEKISKETDGYYRTVADHCELSVREVKELAEMGKIDLKKLFN